MLCASNRYAPESIPVHVKHELAGILDVIRHALHRKVMTMPDYDDTDDDAAWWHRLSLPLSQVGQNAVEAKD